MGLRSAASKHLLVVTFVSCATFASCTVNSGAVDQTEILVVVEDVAPLLASLQLPELQGRAVIPCSVDRGVVQGRRAYRQNGVDTELLLSARYSRPLPQTREVRAQDLEDLQLTYSDDLLNFRGISEQHIPELIRQLRKSEHRTTVEIGIIPGGEILYFSPPMKNLMLLGDRSRQALHVLIGDQEIANEVAVILGAIGNEETVRLLIDAYPKKRVAESVPVRDPDALRIVCASFSLAYLTGVEIGWSRWGTDFTTDNPALWKEWWAKNSSTFKVPNPKPNASWVPCYPSFEWISVYRQQFMNYASKSPDR